MYPFSIKAVFITVLAVAAIGSEAATKKVIPTSITTLQGKHYNATRLVRAEPDGLVVEYAPQEGGFGMAKLKFRNLPEDLRREFNYDESTAASFEAQVRQAAAEQAQARASEPSRPIPEAETLDQEPGMGALPTGRFQASVTIRGAMILDTVTGQAWMADLHSVLNDYQDLNYFLRPKVPDAGAGVLVP